MRLSAIALTFGLLALGAMACHPLGQHLASIHDQAEDEDVCIELEDGVSMPLATPAAKLAGSLGVSTSASWEQVSRVHFDIEAAQECENLSNRSDYEIEVVIYEAGETLCPNGNPCTEGLGESYVAVDHVHWRRLEVKLDEDQMLDEEYEAQISGVSKPLANEHIINHEFEHVLGLADPEEPLEEQGLNRCYYEEEPILSIMHSPVYCGHTTFGFPAYPTRGDLGMVELIVADD